MVTLLAFGWRQGGNRVEGRSSKAKLPECCQSLLCLAFGRLFRFRWPERSIAAVS